MTTITASMVKELRDMTGSGMMECKKALQESNGDVQVAIDNMRKNGQLKAAKRAGRVAAEGVVMIAASNDGSVCCMTEINCETDFVARDTGFKAFSDMMTKTGLSIKANDVPALMSQKIKQGDNETCDAAREALVAKVGENIQVRRVATLSSAGCVGYYIHGDRIGVLVALDKKNLELAKDIAMHIAATNPAAIDADGVAPELLAKEREIVTAQAQGSGKPDNIIEKMVEGRLQKFVKEICLVHQPFVKNPEVTVQSLLTAAGTKVLKFVRFEVGEGIEKPVSDLAAEVDATLEDAKQR